MKYQNINKIGEAFCRNIYGLLNTIYSSLAQKQGDGSIQSDIICGLCVIYPFAEKKTHRSDNIVKRVKCRSVALVLV